MIFCRRCFFVAMVICVTTTVADEPTGTKYLIIHADDAGMCNSVNRATATAMQDGFVSSASIMVPCAWFTEFAKHCRENPDGDYGIHLTLTSEWDFYRWGPVAPPEQVPSLVDPDGYLWDNTDQVAKHVKVEEAEIELRAQIDRAKQFGVPLSHLDTHMGAVMTRPDLYEMYIKLGTEYDLPVLTLRAEKAQLRLAVAYPQLLKVVGGLSKKLDEKELPQLDAIYQYYDKGEHSARRDKYMHMIRSLKPGITEVIIHCGFDNEELKSVTSSSGLRDSDRRCFSDPDVLALIKAENVEITTWKKLTEMQRNK
jgi:predicted glycoside hydrolase/deacetylase ChbG (UPF0249 family)